MSKKILAAASLLVAGTLIAGCETTSSRPYKASTENIMAAQTALRPSGVKVSVAPFTAADGVDISPTCRAMGALEVAPGKTPVEYIQSAMQEELFAAGVLDANGTTISGRVEELSFNSFGTGSWSVKLHVSSPALPAGYTVTKDYSFKTSFSAIMACQNVIDAFQPTVSELINDVVTHPEFTALAGASTGM